jgi:hypothetical protein
MIDVKDLTIGNWVYDGDRTQFPMQVVGIGSDYVYLDFEGNEGDLWESKPEDLMEIPLTPELLKGLGMTFSYGLWRHRLGIKVKPEVGFVSIENKDKDDWLYGTCNCKDIWHLHQLQNLVRIITKKELKINLWN